MCAGGTGPNHPANPNTQFGPGARRQLDTRDATRQGLRNARHQVELRRAREHDFAHAAALVHHRLQPGQQRWAGLHFVDDSERAKVVLPD